jgi:CubicO group peptidase (beta-lactamase class C family)
MDGAQSAYAKPPVFPAGDAGLLSTVDDYLIFARMMLNGGKHGNKQILRAESVREMTRDQLTAELKSASAKNLFPGFFDTHGWGYGLAVSRRPTPSRRFRDVTVGWAASGPTSSSIPSVTSSASS